MKALALAVAGFAAFTAPAAAQYFSRPIAPIGLFAPDDVFEIVREMGFDPIGRPVRNGPIWIQRAVDDYGRLLRVMVDARRARVVGVEPIGRMPVAYGRPYAPTGGPYAYGPRPYPYVMPDDEAFAPPRPMMAIRGQPQAALPPAISPHAALPPQTGLPPSATQPKQKSAAVTPSLPPVPRKRPSSAPQEAAGSVEPLQAAPKAEPAPVVTGSTNAAPSAPVAKPAPAMPPVAPLD